MKQTGLFILLLLTCSIAHAQIRHVKGMVGFEGKYLRSSQGSAYAFGFSKYLTSKQYLKASVGVENGKYGKSSFSAYMLCLDYNHTAFHIKDIVFFNAVAGLATTYDKLEDETFDEYNAFQFGLNIGTDIEIYVNDRLIILVGANQLFDHQDDFGKGRFFYGAGIKLSL